MIEFKGVNKSYKTKQGYVKAVNDVSLTINRGELFGVIGFSGAGKSSLVRCINMLEKPDSGDLIVNGLNMTTLGNSELRQARTKIGMIFQHFNLFRSRTVRENIAYPLKFRGYSKSEIDTKVNILLDLVGLSDKAEMYPSQLSGGQKQRVGIARALANDPEILLCDEATSALDPQTTESILELIRDLNKKLGLTVVIITHEMQVIKSLCNRAAIMSDGRILELGTVFDIFSNPKEELTKQFVKTTSPLSKIYKLIEEKSPVVELKSGEILAKLNYTGPSTVNALISTVTLKFNVLINIIFGDLDIIDHTPMGGLIVIFSGEPDSVFGAIEWIKQNNVRIEVIKYG